MPDFDRTGVRFVAEGVNQFIRDLTRASVAQMDFRDTVRESNRDINRTPTNLRKIAGDYRFIAQGQGEVAKAVQDTAKSHRQNAQAVRAFSTIATNEFRQSGRSFRNFFRLFQGKEERTIRKSLILQERAARAANREFRQFNKTLDPRVIDQYGQEFTELDHILSSVGRTSREFNRNVQDRTLRRVNVRRFGDELQRNTDELEDVLNRLPEHLDNREADAYIQNLRDIMALARSTAGDLQGFKDELNIPRTSVNTIREAQDELSRAGRLLNRIGPDQQQNLARRLSEGIERSSKDFRRAAQTQVSDLDAATTEVVQEFFKAATAFDESQQSIEQRLQRIRKIVGEFDLPEGDARFNKLLAEANREVTTLVLAGQRLQTALGEEAPAAVVAGIERVIKAAEAQRDALAAVNAEYANPDRVQYAGFLAQTAELVEDISFQHSRYTDNLSGPELIRYIDNLEEQNQQLIDTRKNFVRLVRGNFIRRIFNRRLTREQQQVYDDLNRTINATGKELDQLRQDNARLFLPRRIGQFARTLGRIGLIAQLGGVDIAAMTGEVNLLHRAGGIALGGFIAFREEINQRLAPVVRRVLTPVADAVDRMGDLFGVVRMRVDQFINRYFDTLTLTTAISTALGGLPAPFVGLATGVVAFRKELLNVSERIPVLGERIAALRQLGIRGLFRRRRRGDDQEPGDDDEPPDGGGPRTTPPPSDPAGGPAQQTRDATQEASRQAAEATEEAAQGLRDRIRNLFRRGETPADQARDSASRDQATASDAVADATRDSTEAIREETRARREATNEQVSQATEGTQASRQATEATAEQTEVTQEEVKAAREALSTEEQLRQRRERLAREGPTTEAERAVRDAAPDDPDFRPTEPGGQPSRQRRPAFPGSALTPLAFGREGLAVTIRGQEREILAEGRRLGASLTQAVVDEISKVPPGEYEAAVIRNLESLQRALRGRTGEAVEQARTEISALLKRARAGELAPPDLFEVQEFTRIRSGELLANLAPDNVLKGIERASASSAEFTDELRKSGDASDETRAELEDLAAQAEAAGESWDDLGDQATQAGAAVRDAADQDPLAIVPVEEQQNMLDFLEQVQTDLQALSRVSRDDTDLRNTAETVEQLGEGLRQNAELTRAEFEQTLNFLNNIVQRYRVGPLFDPNVLVDQDDFFDAGQGAGQAFGEGVQQGADPIDLDDIVTMGDVQRAVDQGITEDDAIAAGLINAARDARAEVEAEGRKAGEAASDAVEEGLNQEPIALTQRVRIDTLKKIIDDARDELRKLQKDSNDPEFFKGPIDTLTALRSELRKTRSLTLDTLAQLEAVVIRTIQGFSLQSVPVDQFFFFERREIADQIDRVLQEAIRSGDEDARTIELRAELQLLAEEVSDPDIEQDRLRDIFLRVQQLARPPAEDPADFTEELSRVRAELDKLIERYAQTAEAENSLGQGALRALRQLRSELDAEDVSEGALRRAAQVVDTLTGSGRVARAEMETVAKAAEDASEVAARELREMLRQVADPTTSQDIVHETFGRIATSPDIEQAINDLRRVFRRGGVEAARDYSEGFQTIASQFVLAEQIRIAEGPSTPVTPFALDQLERLITLGRRAEANVLGEAFLPQGPSALRDELTDTERAMLDLQETAAETTRETRGRMSELDMLRLTGLRDSLRDALAIDAADLPPGLFNQNLPRELVQGVVERFDEAIQSIDGRSTFQSIVEKLSRGDRQALRAYSQRIQDLFREGLDTVAHDLDEVQQLQLRDTSSLIARVFGRQQLQEDPLSPARVQLRRRAFQTLDDVRVLQDPNIAENLEENRGRALQQIDFIKQDFLELGEAIKRFTAPDIAEGIRQQAMQALLILQQHSEQIELAGKGISEGVISSFAEAEFDEVDRWLLQLAKRLIGSSPPEIGPLSTIDIGGGLTIQAWIDSLTDRGRIRDIEAFTDEIVNVFDVLRQRVEERLDAIQGRFADQIRQAADLLDTSDGQLPSQAELDRLIDMSRGAAMEARESLMGLRDEVNVVTEDIARGLTELAIRQPDIETRDQIVDAGLRGLEPVQDLSEQFAALSDVLSEVTPVTREWVEEVRQARRDFGVDLPGDVRPRVIQAPDDSPEDRQLREVEDELDQAGRAFEREFMMALTSDALRPGQPLSLEDLGVRDAMRDALENLLDGLGRGLSVEDFRSADPSQLPQLDRAQLQEEANDQFRNLQAYLLTQLENLIPNLQELDVLTNARVIDDAVMNAFLGIGADVLTQVIRLLQHIEDSIGPGEQFGVEDLRRNLIAVLDQAQSGVFQAGENLIQGFFDEFQDADLSPVVAMLERIRDTIQSAEPPTLPPVAFSDQVMGFGRGLQALGDDVVRLDTIRLLNNEELIPQRENILRFIRDTARQATDLLEAFPDFAQHFDAPEPLRGQFLEEIQRNLNIVRSQIDEAGIDLAQGYLDDFRDADFGTVIRWLELLSDYFIGDSPPRLGPLSELDVGAERAIQAWIDELTDRGSIGQIQAFVAEVSQAFGVLDVGAGSESLGAEFGKGLAEGITPGVDRVVDHLRGLLPGSDPDLIPGWRRDAMLLGEMFIDQLALGVLSGTTMLTDAIRQVRERALSEGLPGQRGAEALLGRVASLPAEILTTTADVRELPSITGRRRFSNRERRATRRFTSPAANVTARVRAGDIGDDLRGTVFRMDDLIERADAPVPRTAFRGLFGAFAESAAMAIRGARIFDRGFISTTLAPAIASLFAGRGMGLGQLIEIAFAREAGSALSLLDRRPRRLSTTPGQLEFVLPREGELQREGEREVLFRRFAEGLRLRDITAGGTPLNTVDLLEQSGLLDLRRVAQFTQIPRGAAGPTQEQLDALRPPPTIADQIRERVSFADISQVMMQGMAAAEAFIRSVAESIGMGAPEIERAVEFVLRQLFENPMAAMRLGAGLGEATSEAYVEAVADGAEEAADYLGAASPFARLGALGRSIAGRVRTLGRSIGQTLSGALNEAVEEGTDETTETLSEGLSRRDFLRTLGVGAAGTALGQTPLARLPEITGPAAPPAAGNVIRLTEVSADALGILRRLNDELSNYYHHGADFLDQIQSDNEVLQRLAARAESIGLDTPIPTFDIDRIEQLMEARFDELDKFVRRFDNLLQFDGISSTVAAPEGTEARIRAALETPVERELDQLLSQVPHELIRIVQESASRNFRLLQPITQMGMRFGTILQDEARAIRTASPQFIGADLAELEKTLERPAGLLGGNIGRFFRDPYIAAIEQATEEAADYLGASSPFARLGGLSRSIAGRLQALGRGLASALMEAFNQRVAEGTEETADTLARERTRREHQMVRSGLDPALAEELSDMRFQRVIGLPSLPTTAEDRDFEDFMRQAIREENLAEFGRITSFTGIPPGLDTARATDQFFQQIPGVSPGERGVFPIDLVPLETQVAALLRDLALSNEQVDELRRTPPHEIIADREGIVFFLQAVRGDIQSLAEDYQRIFDLESGVGRDEVSRFRQRFSEIQGVLEENEKAIIQASRDVGAGYFEGLANADFRIIIQWLEELAAYLVGTTPIRIGPLKDLVGRIFDKGAEFTDALAGGIGSRLNTLRSVLGEISELTLNAATAGRAQRLGAGIGESITEGLVGSLRQGVDTGADAAVDESGAGLLSTLRRTVVNTFLRRLSVSLPNIVLTELTKALIPQLLRVVGNAIGNINFIRHILAALPLLVAGITRIVPLIMAALNTEVTTQINRVVLREIDGSVQAVAVESARETFNFGTLIRAIFREIGLQIHNAINRLLGRPGEVIDSGAHATLLATQLDALSTIQQSTAEAARDQLRGLANEATQQLISRGVVDPNGLNFLAEARDEIREAAVESTRDTLRQQSRNVFDALAEGGEIAAADRDTFIRISDEIIDNAIKGHQESLETYADQVARQIAADPTGATAAELDITQFLDLEDVSRQTLDTIARQMRVDSSELIGLSVDEAANEITADFTSDLGASFIGNVINVLGAEIGAFLFRVFEVLGEIITARVLPKIGLRILSNQLGQAVETTTASGISDLVPQLLVRLQAIVDFVYGVLELEFFPFRLAQLVVAQVQAIRQRRFDQFGAILTDHIIRFLDMLYAPVEQLARGRDALTLEDRIQRLRQPSDAIPDVAEQLRAGDGEVAQAARRLGGTAGQNIAEGGEQAIEEGAERWAGYIGGDSPARFGALRNVIRRGISLGMTAGEAVGRGLQQAIERIAQTALDLLLPNQREVDERLERVGRRFRDVESISGRATFFIPEQQSLLSRLRDRFRRGGQEEAAPQARRSTEEILTSIEEINRQVREEAKAAQSRDTGQVVREGFERFGAEVRRQVMQAFDILTEGVSAAFLPAATHFAITGGADPIGSAVFGAFGAIIRVIGRGVDEISDDLVRRIKGEQEREAAKAAEETESALRATVRDALGGLALAIGVAIAGIDPSRILGAIVVSGFATLVNFIGEQAIRAVRQAVESRQVADAAAVDTRMQQLFEDAARLDRLSRPTDVEALLPDDEIVRRAAARLADRAIEELEQDFREGGKEATGAWGEGAVEGLEETIDEIQKPLRDLGDNLFGDSPPPKGPLRRMAEGAFQAGAAWRQNFVRAIQGAIDPITNAAFGIRDALEESRPDPDQFENFGEELRHAYEDPLRTLTREVPLLLFTLGGSIARTAGAVGQAVGLVGGTIIDAVEFTLGRLVGFIPLFGPVLRELVEFPRRAINLLVELGVGLARRLRAFFEAGVNFIRNQLEALGRFIGRIGETIIRPLLLIGAAIAGAIRNVFVGIFSGIVNVVINPLRGIAGAILSVLGGIANVILTPFRAVGRALGRIASLWVEVTIGPWRELAKLIIRPIAAIVDAITAPFRGLIRTIADIFKRISEIILAPFTGLARLLGRPLVAVNNAVVEPLKATLGEAMSLTDEFIQSQRQRGEELFQARVAEPIEVGAEADFSASERELEEFREFFQNMLDFIQDNADEVDFNVLRQELIGMSVDSDVLADGLDGLGDSVSRLADEFEAAQTPEEFTAAIQEVLAAIMAVREEEKRLFDQRQQQGGGGISGGRSPFVEIFSDLRAVGTNIQQLGLGEGFQRIFEVFEDITDGLDRTSVAIQNVGNVLGEAAAKARGFFAVIAPALPTIIALGAALVGIATLAFRGVGSIGLIEGFAGSGVALQELRDAAADTIPDLRLMEITNVALAGASDEVRKAFGEELPKVLTIARATARATNQEVTHLVESITEGVRKASPELIDNVGIVVRINEANEEYAATLGKTVEQLTASERQVALLTAVLAHHEDAVESLANTQETAAEKIARITSTAVNLIDRAATAVQPLFGVILDGVSAVLTAVSDILTPIITIIFEINKVLADGIRRVVNFFREGLEPIADAVRRAYRRIEAFGREVILGFAQVAGTFVGFIIGTLERGLDLIRQFVSTIGDLLIGASPTKAGPLSKIDVGAEAVAQTWIDSFVRILAAGRPAISEELRRAVDIDFRPQAAQQVAAALRRFGNIGALNLEQVETRLEALDAHIQPLADHLEIVQSRFEAIQSAAEKALSALDRQIERNLQSVIEGDADAAALVRSLDAQSQAIRTNLRRNQDEVDNAAIRLELARALNAEERTLLEIRKRQLEGDEEAGELLDERLADAAGALSDAADAAGGAGAALDELPGIGEVLERDPGAIPEDFFSREATDFFAEIRKAFEDAVDAQRGLGGIFTIEGREGLLAGLQDAGNRIGAAFEEHILGPINRAIDASPILSFFRDEIIEPLAGLASRIFEDTFTMPELRQQSQTGLQVVRVPVELEGNLLDRIVTLGRRFLSAVGEHVLQPIIDEFRRVFGNEKGEVTVGTIGDAIGRLLDSVPAALEGLPNLLIGGLGGNLAAVLDAELALQRGDITLEEFEAIEHDALSDVLNETIFNPFNDVLSGVATLLRGEDTQVDIGAAAATFIQNLPQHFMNLRSTVESIFNPIFGPGGLIARILLRTFSVDVVPVENAAEAAAAAFAEGADPTEATVMVDPESVAPEGLLARIAFYGARLLAAIEAEVLTPIVDAFRNVFGGESGDLSATSIGQSISNFFNNLEAELTTISDSILNALVSAFGRDEDKAVVAAASAQLEAGEIDVGDFRIIRNEQLIAALDTGILKPFNDVINAIAFLFSDKQEEQEGRISLGRVIVEAIAGFPKIARQLQSALEVNFLIPLIAALQALFNPDLNQLVVEQELIRARVGQLAVDFEGTGEEFEEAVQEYIDRDIELTAQIDATATADSDEDERSLVQRIADGLVEFFTRVVNAAIQAMNESVELRDGLNRLGAHFRLLLHNAFRATPLGFLFPIPSFDELGIEAGSVDAGTFLEGVSRNAEGRLVVDGEPLEVDQELALLARIVEAKDPEEVGKFRVERFEDGSIQVFVDVEQQAGIFGTGFGVIEDVPVGDPIPVDIEFEPDLSVAEDFDILAAASDVIEGILDATDGAAKNASDAQGATGEDGAIDPIEIEIPVTFPDPAEDQDIITATTQFFADLQAYINDVERPAAGGHGPLQIFIPAVLSVETVTDLIDLQNAINTLTEEIAEGEEDVGTILIPAQLDINPFGEKTVIQSEIDDDAALHTIFLPVELSASDADILSDLADIREVASVISLRLPVDLLLSPPSAMSLQDTVGNLAFFIEPTITTTALQTAVQTGLAAIRATLTENQESLTTTLQTTFQTPFTNATNEINRHLTSREEDDTFATQLYNFFVADEETEGSIAWYLSSAVAKFQALPGRVAKALRGFRGVIWRALGLPFVRVINVIIDRFNEFQRQVADLAGSLPGGQQISVPRLTHVSTESPFRSSIPEAQHGGLFGPGAVLVGEAGPEIVVPAQRFGVFPNQFTNALAGASEFLRRQYETPIYSNQTINNVDQRRTHYDQSQRTSFNIGRLDARQLEHLMHTRAVNSRFGR